MAKENSAETLRDRLLIAGTDEIGRYGIADFSLRRVAAACNTSCAAPYRHFKNKEDFILEIIRYINRQWELLRDQILSLFAGDIRRQLAEVCLAYIRFWVANPNYRSVLTASEGKTAGESGKADIDGLIREYCRSVRADETETTRMLCAVKAFLYGITAMLENGELHNTPETFELIRGVIERELRGVEM